MDTLEDIQRRLQESQYKNEEHVRLSLVARVLQEYGWDIWDPTEVNAEFKPVPEEDNKRVDVALFAPSSTPAVFIEVKAVGAITNLPDTERQLRDYNKNITTPFCIITDGREWRFYYSLTPGDFSSKCFKTLNLLNDNLDDIKRTFGVFLDKKTVQSREAEDQAKHLLSLKGKEKVLTECLPEAQRAVLKPAYPRLPDALKDLAEKRGIQVSREEVAAFIEKSVKGPGRRDEDTPDTESPDVEDTPDTEPSDVIKCDPKNPPGLSFTRIISASIGGQAARNWSDLADAGFRLAWQQGQRDVADIRNWSGASIRPGTYTQDGFHPVRDTGLSVPGMSAPKVWEVAMRIAERLRVPIVVHFCWRDKGAHPGKRATMQWPR
jgi:hypothetical protein